MAGATEQRVGEIGRAEADEFRQPLLLVRARVATFGFYGRHEPDRGEIVFGAALPAFGETAIADEPVVLRRKRWLSGNRRVEDLGVVGLKVLCAWAEDFAVGNPP